MTDSNPLKSAMTLPKKIDLKLNDTSTFNDHPKAKGIKSQIELEKTYTNLHNTELAQHTGSYESFWKGFQKKYGVLLASDSPASNPIQEGSQYGEGRPLFKVRFKDGKVVTGTAVQQQLRSWYTQIQTEGSPGTSFPLSKTKDQFFETDDQGRTLKQQIHHVTGIMELSPHLESTLKKLLSKNRRIRNQGQLEYNAFSKFTHKNNVILGDKIENYAGLPESRHINRPESAHGYKGPSLESSGTSYFTTKQSGGPTFSESTRNLLRTGIVPTPQGDLQLSRTSSIGSRSYWNFALKPYIALSGEAGELSTIQARRFPAEETSRSKYQTKLPKNQGSNVRKILTQTYIDQGIRPDRAALMAADAYEGVRTGRSLLKKSYLGFDASVKSGLPYSDYSNIFNAPKPTGNAVKDSLNFERKLTPKSKVKGNVLSEVSSDLKSTRRNVRPVMSNNIQTDVPSLNTVPNLLDIGEPKKIYVDELGTLTFGIGLV